ncbi:MAG: sigma-70 family RNA polymerase sigma factor [Rubrivivax sp.]|nr:sigma-70 family RNA polymerase sigma factor [Rubrivivax sp.]
MGDVTALLHRIADDDRAAFDELFGLLYRDIHRMAHARLHHNVPITLLDTTSLVHEAYLNLQAAGRIDLDTRGRFMAYVSRVLRNVIVDFARRRSAERRGGGHAEVTLDTSIAESVASHDEEIVRIGEALDELDKSDPRLRQVVEMRYFAGLTEVEVATALDLSERTVRRDWERARLLLSVSLKR